MKKTWILFKTEGLSDQGWEDRRLHPSGALTSILAEHIDYSGSARVPQVGDRAREYANLADPGNGVTHGKDGDWQISRVELFSSFGSEDRVVVCFCRFMPVGSDWQELRRGSPVSELMAQRLKSNRE